MYGFQIEVKDVVFVGSGHSESLIVSINVGDGMQCSTIQPFKSLEPCMTNHCVLDYHNLKCFYTKNDINLRSKVVFDHERGKGYDTFYQIMKEVIEPCPVTWTSIIDGKVVKTNDPSIVVK